mgnify:CR=1 FL=1
MVDKSSEKFIKHSVYCFDNFQTGYWFVVVFPSSSTNQVFPNLFW